MLHADWVSENQVVLMWRLMLFSVIPKYRRMLLAVQWLLVDVF
jgi:hypothetical protein